MNLQDSITLFEDFNKKELQEIVRKIDLTGLENYSSLGLFGKNISGGQAQKVAISRSFMQKRALTLKK